MERYCPKCKRVVGKKLTVGQVVVMSILAMTVIGILIYAPLHSRKCPICGYKTEKRD